MKKEIKILEKKKNSVCDCDYIQENYLKKNGFFKWLVAYEILCKKKRERERERETCEAYLDQDS